MTQTLLVSSYFSTLLLLGTGLSVSFDEHKSYSNHSTNIIASGQFRIKIQAPASLQSLSLPTVSVIFELSLYLFFLKDFFIHTLDCSICIYVCLTEERIKLKRVLGHYYPIWL